MSHHMPKHIDKYCTVSNYIQYKKEKKEEEKKNKKNKSLTETQTNDDTTNKINFAS